MANSIKINNSEKNKLEFFFDSINIDYIPSVTNFLTLIFQNEKAAFNFCDSMLKKGVILRHLLSFGLPNCVRVTIGVPEENEFLIQNIKELRKTNVYDG